MTRKRYLTLDAMRGVAAIYVVARHFSDLRGPSQTYFSYLAVDLFFVLSGFVLDLSYGSRLQKGYAVTRYILLRIIRLWPMYMIGAAIGVSGIMLELYLQNMRTSEAIMTFISSFLILPSPTPRFSPILFPTISPAWSLFFEFYIANIAFGVLKGCRRWGVVLAIISTSFIALLGSDIHYGSLDIGQTWSTVLGGFPRVMFSFFVGVVIQRLHVRYPLPWQIPSWMVLVSLMLALSVPVQIVNTSFYEVLCVAFIFPALIYFGSQAVEKQPLIGEILGDISYGIYVIHYPLLKVSERLMSATHTYPSYALEAIFALVMVLAAFILDRSFDKPVRRWLLTFVSREVISLRVT